jgi:hypothetical protein
VGRGAWLPVPGALTAAAWHDCVAWTASDNLRKPTLQDQNGRLWDVIERPAAVGLKYMQHT